MAGSSVFSMKLHLTLIIVSLMLAVSATSCTNIGVAKINESVRQRAPKNWSIGILRGPKLSSLKDTPLCPNPRITRDDVTEPLSEFVADPFLIRDAGEWYLFFESFNAKRQRGEIAWAHSRDLCHWSYRGTALSSDVHLSYPYVFNYDGRIYMVPESRQAGVIQLYRARRFPDSWRPERVLIRGEYSDASVVRYHGRWWIFANQAPYGLAIFSANKLTDQFVPHPQSPLYLGDASKARPAGRILIIDGMLYRFVQDNTTGYGRHVRLLRVVELTPEIFREQIVLPDPFLQGSDVGWNGFGMHHVSAEQLSDGAWVAAVDGNAHEGGESKP